MPVRLINYVNNQVSSPALYTGIFSVRPAAGIFGRLFMSIDTKEIYQDLTTSWQLLADAGAGAGTLESVTANGNSTTYGISILSGNLSMTNAASSFNYKAITTGSILFSADSSGLISQNNANFFWDNTSNRLGIGTAAPSAKLDIHSTSGTTAIFNGAAASNALLTFQNTAVSKWSIGNFVSSTVANDFVVYDTVNTTPRFLIHNTGVINIPTTLIIGTTTATSAFAFDVTGSGKFTSTLTLGTMTSGSVLFAGASGVISQDNANLFFDDTNNRLGIGTATPTNLLTIKNNNGGTQGIDFQSYSTSSVQAQIIHNQADDSFNIINSSAFAAGGIAFKTNGTEKARILTNGNVLIGSSTDNGYRLQVTGSTGATYIGNAVKTEGSDSAYIYQNRSSSTYYSLYAVGGVSYFNNVNTSTNIAQINMTTGVYTPLSNINEKKDFELCTIGLDAILKLKPTLYRMKEDDENIEKHLGFIAQEVKEFIPQAYVENDNFIGLSDRPIIAVLVKALQELNEKLIRNNIN